MTKDAKAIHDVIRLCSKLHSAVEMLDKVERTWGATGGPEENKDLVSDSIKNVIEVKDALPDIIIDLIKPKKKRNPNPKT